MFFADNLGSDATLAGLAACFEELGGVPKTALTDRMGCLKGGTVAGVVVPTADYVRFATHYGFRPDFCEGQDPESKGLVENLVGYVKSDLMIPAELTVTDLAAANTAGRSWCVEVNAAVHSEIAAVPAECLLSEGALLGPLPSLRAQIGKLVIRKVDTQCLQRIETGAGTDNDLEIMGGWLPRVTDASRCYLASEERIVVSSILRAFPEEFADHIEHQRCPSPRHDPMPKLVDLTDGHATYDETFWRKRPDWTYDPE